MARGSKWRRKTVVKSGDSGWWVAVVVVGGWWVTMAGGGCNEWVEAIINIEEWVRLGSNIVPIGTMMEIKRMNQKRRGNDRDDKGNDELIIYRILCLDGFIGGRDVFGSCMNKLIFVLKSRVLKSQNLGGILPPELVKLPYLQEFDISRNYVNGTIPPEWGSLPLVNIILEFNELSGDLPQELGNLSSITRLRIGDNFFTGSIPNFIQNWIHLEALLIQASGLDGPIPSGIAFLTNMTDLSVRNLSLFQILSILRISDLNGSKVSDFPFVGNMTKLKRLDLSFNKLSGEIPSTFKNLSNLTSMKQEVDKQAPCNPLDYLKKYVTRESCFALQRRKRKGYFLPLIFDHSCQIEIRIVNRNGIVPNHESNRES
ncbi:hypothetical protein TEA_025023 [Camellia sinensis var. sinensis]|uniref:Uncharacterized protein n=1 Tax=Camellia sinensis var. sinensis TaxID=542762 RepID=A0A4S4E7W8_CAMSN|nr:hypothetical protein TEA_025023 [Camellia sinensis var. sinensis]